jgi:WD40 repeat protein
MASNPERPVGTVTFLFTDIEKSTENWVRQRDAMPRKLRRHNAVLHRVILAHDGVVFNRVGDAFCASFADAADAAAAAVAAQRALRREVPELRVRMALHTGEPEWWDGDYYGLDLSRVARLVMAGHGEQILLTRDTVEHVQGGLTDDSHLHLLGRHHLRDLPLSEAIYQLQAPDLPSRFPPLNTLDVAFRRGLVKAMSISAVVLSLMAGLTARAVTMEKRARVAATMAEASRRTERTQRYVAEMNLAFEALKDRRFDRLRHLLDEQRPRAGEEDLRGFEWRYLWRRSHRGRLLTAAPQDMPALLQFRPDGKTLITSPQPFVVQRRQVETGQLLETVRMPWDEGGRELTYTSRALSPDGRALAVAMIVDAPPNAPRAAAGWEVRICNWSGPRTQDVIFRGREPNVRSLAFSSDGKLLAGITHGAPGSQPASAIKLWDRATRRVTTFPGPAGTDMVALAFSPDSRLLAAVATDGRVLLWELTHARLIARLRGPGNRWASLAFSPDSRALAVGGSAAAGFAMGAGDLRLWDLTTRHPRDLLMDGVGIHSVVYSPDGRLLAACAADGTVRLWNTKTMREADRLEGHTGLVTYMAFSPDGRTLATASEDRTLRLWNVGTAPPPDVVDAHRADGGLAGLAFSPDGRLLATIGRSGTVRLWSASAGQEVARHTGLPAPDFPAQFAFDGRRVAVAQGSIIRLWDRLTQRETTLRHGGDPIFCLGFAPNRQVLVAGTENGTVEFWDLIARTSTRLHASDTAVTQLTLSQDGQFLATVAKERVRVWRVATMTRVAEPRVEGVSGATFAPDGSFLALVRARELALWRPATGEILGFPAHARDLGTAAVAPDGRTVMTFADDGVAMLWHAPAGQELGSLDAPRQLVAAAISADGGTMAAGDERGRLHFWRAATLTEADARPSRR